MFLLLVALTPQPPQPEFEWATKHGVCGACTVQLELDADGVVVSTELGECDLGLAGPSLDAVKWAQFEGSGEPEAHTLRFENSELCTPQGDDPDRVWGYAEPTDEPEWLSPSAGRPSATLLPAYPDGEQGEQVCTARLTVDPKGRVQRVQVWGCPESFAEPTRSSLSRWVYSSLDKDGSPTWRVVQQDLHFSPDLPLAVLTAAGATPEPVEEETPQEEPVEEPEFEGYSSVEQSAVSSRRFAEPLLPAQYAETGAYCEVRLFVDKRGAVERTEIEACDEGFEAPVTAAASEWRFQKYREEGVPTPWTSVFIIEPLGSDSDLSIRYGAVAWLPGEMPKRIDPTWVRSFQEVDPKYPEGTAAGVCPVLMTVDKVGVVQDVEIDATCPEPMRDATLEAARRWRFRQLEIYNRYTKNTRIHEFAVVVRFHYEPGHDPEVWYNWH